MQQVMVSPSTFVQQEPQRQRFTSRIRFTWPIFEDDISNQVDFLFAFVASLTSTCRAPSEGERDMVRGLRKWRKISTT